LESHPFFNFYLGAQMYKIAQDFLHTTTMLPPYDKDTRPKLSKNKEGD
jgi:hypothetical protein